MECLTAEEEAGPSPIRASRVWAQDDNESKGSGKKDRRPTLDTEGSGTRKKSKNHSL